LADYGVNTRHCQPCGASLLRFLVEMFPASLHLRKKTQVLQENVKIYSLVFTILACDWQQRKMPGKNSRSHYVREKKIMQANSKVQIVLEKNSCRGKMHKKYPPFRDF
jgi:hypothetical protein